MMAKLYAETCRSNDRLQYCVYKKLTKTEFILKKYQDWYDDYDDDDDVGGCSGTNGGVMMVVMVILRITTEISHVLKFESNTRN